MNLAERLRGVIRPAGGPEGPPLLACNGEIDSDDRRGAPSGAPGGDSADVLGGEWREAGAQRYLIVDRTYLPGHRLGRVAVADCLPDADGRWPRLGLLMTGADSAVPPGRLLFLDLETTGLTGGAGTYAFLVGCGWFDGAVFRTRQFVLTSFAAERALLEEIDTVIRAAGVLVTYNGKTFDAPLIDTRFLFHRLTGPCSALAHIDLLHPARRLWRPAVDWALDGGSASCRLSLMERSILGHVREDDVPGVEIPSRYFHFVRSGDARGLQGVLEHNRIDLLALAMLTARAGRLLDEGAPAARSAREALGLGCLYERGGLLTDARACFARAIDFEADAGTHVEALRAFAVLCRRERRYAEAADAWRRLLAVRGCPPRIAQEATDALAIHHEHRARDLPAARQFAIQSLQFKATRSRLDAVHHRLARIDRKMGGSSPQVAALF
jgi:uncharacterized protein YprB with RNaseH-like and TPR domain